MRPSPVFLLAVLAGCATMADVDRAKNTWQGAQYDDVVSRWGAPTRSATLQDGRRVATWVTEGAGRRGFPASVGVYGGSGGGGVGAVIGLPGSGGGEIQQCERTLTFRDGRVADQSWIGPASFCSAFRKE